MATSEVIPFPTSSDEFNNDDRVSWDTVENKHVLIAENGKEYEWNTRHSKWVEMVDEDLIKAQQAAYYNAEEEEPAPAENGSKKRKADEKPSQGNKKAKTERVNSSVYVTGIPTDASFDEIHALFKKYGLIANNIDSETPRIKMYADDEDNFKGEALITYFRPESIHTAVYLLDKTDFRNGGAGDMHVEEADMSFKKQKEVTDSSQAKARRSRKDVEKIKKMTNEMNARLGDWDDEEPQTLELEAKPANKWDKVVTIKHMFTPEQLEKEPELLVELPEDIRDQAKEEEWGEIANITIFDKEAEGVVRVRFRDAEGATKAQMRMDGRWFDNRQLVAYIPDKKETFHKSQYDEEEEKLRLANYGLDIGESENGEKKAGKEA